MTIARGPLKRWLGAAALSVCLISPAVADPVNELIPQGFVKGSQSFNLSIGGNVSAGGFKGTWDAQSIIFWCIELTQYFGFGGDYTNYVPSEPDNTTMTLLGKLFSEAYGSATSDEAHSAAFQLAIWEIVYDPLNLNLSGGSFKVLSGNAGTVALAQGWLDNLAQYTDTYHLFVLHSPTAQDFITTGGPNIPRLSVVPEPGTIALLAVGLIAIWFVAGGARRRRGLQDSDKV